MFLPDAHKLGIIRMEYVAVLTGSGTIGRFIPMNKTQRPRATSCFVDISKLIEYFCINMNSALSLNVFFHRIRSTYLLIFELLF